MKGPGRDLGRAIRVAPEKLHVTQLHRARSPDGADHARHLGLVAVAVGDHRGLVHVHALQRGGEAVGVALAPDLAVADHVDAGPLHVADGHHGGVVLGLLEDFLRHPPDAPQTDPRDALRQQGPIDEPVRLGIAADDGSGERLPGHDLDLRRA